MRQHGWKKLKQCCIHQSKTQASMTEAIFPAQLLLTFDIFYIPRVHFARNHGANIREKSEEVRSHATDQTPDLGRANVKPATVYCLNWSGVSAR